MKAHGAAPRGLRPLPRSPMFEGRFGRLFRRLPPAPPLEIEQLRELADKMREPAEQGGGWQPAAPPTNLDNPDIPAGYTYFGQFVDHDLTFDPASSFDRDNDPDALVNFRTPRFDLDSVYGSGPHDEPFQYDRNQPGKFLIGNAGGVEDVPRNTQGIALIGDPRNDENVIVSGLQLVFLKLHNKLFDMVSQDATVPEEQRFDETQRLVRWHYQRVIVTDFLPLLVGEHLVKRLLRVSADGVNFDLAHYRPRKNAYIPVEFSVAAYRFGHSQIRPSYTINNSVGVKPIFATGDAVGESDDLRGRRPLPNGWTIDWSLFLPIGGSTPQPSRLIDRLLASALFDLPEASADKPQSLALRNLLRGQAFELPSGQDVARFLKVSTVFSGSDLDAPEPTPLWFYVLGESERTAKNPDDPATTGRQLGPVGGRIVAEVMLGILRVDGNSYLNRSPNWTPTAPAADASRLTLGELIHFATT